MKTRLWNVLSYLIRRPEALSRPGRYVSAVVISALALMLRKSLGGLLGATNPYHTAWAAVTISAFYLGFWPSILTMALCATGVSYFFRPLGSLVYASGLMESFGLIGFLLLSLLLIALGEANRRTHAERQRLYNENSWRGRLLDLANDAVFVMDLNEKIVYWNHGAERLYGFSAQQAMGRNPHELLQTKFPDGIVPKAIQAKMTANGDGDWTGELVHTSCNGQKVRVESRWSLSRDEKLNLTGTFEINRDIHELKAAHEALIKAEKLASVGRLAATIVHEINNPLEAASNAAYLIEQTSGVGGKVQEYARSIQEEIQRAAFIARNTLNFYRESGQPTALNMGELVDSVVQLQQKQMSKLSVHVDTRIQTVQAVLGYPGELRQVLGNIVRNAIEATGRNGKLVICAYDSKHFRTDEEGVRVIVADSGSGISAENRSKLFTPFWTTKGEQGTGVGLWVTRQLVKKHGGEIRFRSQRKLEGLALSPSGTIFMVWLPLRGAEITEEFRNGGGLTDAFIEQGTAVGAR